MSATVPWPHEAGLAVASRWRSAAVGAWPAASTCAGAVPRLAERSTANSYTCQIDQACWLSAGGARHTPATVARLRGPGSNAHSRARAAPRSFELLLGAGRRPPLPLRVRARLICCGTRPQGRSQCARRCPLSPSWQSNMRPPGCHSAGRRPNTRLPSARYGAQQQLVWQFRLST